MMVSTDEIVKRLHEQVTTTLSNLTADKAIEASEYFRAPFGDTIYVVGDYSWFTNNGTLIVNMRPTKVKHGVVDMTTHRGVTYIRVGLDMSKRERDLLVEHGINISMALNLHKARDPEEVVGIKEAKRLMSL